MHFTMQVLLCKRFSTLLRIHIIRYFKKHSSFWYASAKYYSYLVKEDIFIRDFITNNFKFTSISKIEIHRNVLNAIVSVNINLYVAEASFVRNKYEKKLLKLRNMLSSVVNFNFGSRTISINLVDVKSPNSDARFLGQFARKQLELRVPFRRVIRATILKAQRVKVKGIKVQISGRLNGNEIARTEWVREGQVPLHTLKADIDYCSCEAILI
jgi:small subunit ribosomal protein S3